MGIRICSLGVLRSTMAACLVAAVSMPVPAQTIWSGYTKPFTKPSGSDGDLPENQDILTENVTFARGYSSGLYNAASETFYSQYVSPADTFWATELVVEDDVFVNEGLEIAASNWEELTFTNWVDAFGGPGTFLLPDYITTYNAVVYLEPDGVYMDIQFSSWGGNGDAGFSYMRGEPASGCSLSGDFDASCAVENGDLTLLLNNWGQAVPPVPDGWTGSPQPTGPAVDNDELTALLNDWGATAGAGGGAAASRTAPEPTTTFLSLCGLLAMITLRPFRR